ncbi:hypothetical protein N7533_002616 [Penicillium manginii]|jgi:hypothetical protein|uniref:uncharacterized protein n=1 Tax=Penicillium manginii TaxID=203109 RepID=UPI0025485C8E|nr:uncharacterized protein N7533_002616 [Penicillium manginii]KAJ5763935.1 hypothetical protein N7533_002616 [Penicillium manginii]
MDWSTRSRNGSAGTFWAKESPQKPPLTLIHVGGAAIYEAIELSPSQEDGCVFQTLSVSFPVPCRWIPTGD